MSPTVPILQQAWQGALWLASQLRRHSWLVALSGFGLGLASFLLIERRASLATTLAGLMLASWLVLLLENSFRSRISRWLGIELPTPLLRVVTQMIHQESLFFVLPFYLLTTTWTEPQALFTGLLALAAVAAVIDPFYHGFIGRRRWLLIGFHTFTLFCLLLTALPLILHLSTRESFYWALGTAVALSIPSLAGVIPARVRWRQLALLGLPLALGGVAWAARPWVPPATLWLTHNAVTQTLDVDRRRPGQALASISQDALNADGLYAYTAIRAPRGLHEPVEHVWLHNGHEVDRIPLTITGGRKQGYRAWSHKLHFPPHARGEWEVRVVTDGGQMVGRMGFTVSGSTQPRRSSTTVTPLTLEYLRPAYDERITP
ncbi:DUF5924 family protein [Marinobacteraceae bacterium S3BR75-40.1]